jgi:hypothetical protein
MVYVFTNVHVSAANDHNQVSIIRILLKIIHTKYTKVVRKVKNVLPYKDIY